MKSIVLISIKAYQIISKFINKRSCRFYPTCSEYAYQSIKGHGVIEGAKLSIKRIFRCNPWNEGGHDPVPEIGGGK